MNVTFENVGTSEIMEVHSVYVLSAQTGPQGLVFSGPSKYNYVWLKRGGVASIRFWADQPWNTNWTAIGALYTPDANGPGEHIRCNVARQGLPRAIAA